MGYRTTIISQHYSINTDLPQWFIDKYKDDYNMTGVISSKYERKYYSREEDEFFIDYQKVLKGKNTSRFLQEIGVDFALLHEDGCIDKITVTSEDIIFHKESIGFSQLRY